MNSFWIWTPLISTTPNSLLNPNNGTNTDSQKFHVDNERYLQLHGIAMGMRMAPLFTNLFLANLEDRLLTWNSARPYIWWRYINDVFAIWNRGQDQLDVFTREINEFHHSIKFTAEVSTYRVTFLDTTVILEGVTIRTLPGQTCTQNQQIPISFCPWIVAIGIIPPPQFPTART